MYFTKTFITTLIVMFLEVVFFVNILFTFDLVGNTGLPILGSVQSTYSDKYFGVTSIIESFKLYWSTSLVQSGFSTIFDSLLKAIRFMDLGNLIKYVPINNVGMAMVGDLLTAIFLILNVFVNIPFILLVIVYFFLFLIYVLSIIIQFLLFFIYLLQGNVYSYLPNTYGLQIDITSALFTIQNSFAF